MAAYRWILTLLLLVSALVSTSLTAMFGYNLGSGFDSSVAISLFVVICVLLDISKTVLPMMAMLTFRSSPALSISLTALSCVLIVLSFTASFSAFEQSISQHQSESSAHRFLQQRISALQLEVEADTRLAEKKESIGHISAAADIGSAISLKNTKIAELQDQLLNTEGDSVLSKYGSQINLAFSVTLEMLCIFTGLTLAHLKTLENQKQSNTESPKSTSSGDISELSKRLDSAVRDLTCTANELSKPTVFEVKHQTKTTVLRYEAGSHKQRLIEWLQEMKVAADANKVAWQLDLSVYQARGLLEELTNEGAIKLMDGKYHLNCS